MQGTWLRFIHSLNVGQSNELSDGKRLGGAIWVLLWDHQLRNEAIHAAASRQRIKAWLPRSSKAKGVARYQTTLVVLSHETPGLHASMAWKKAVVVGSSGILEGKRWMDVFPSWVGSVGYSPPTGKTIKKYGKLRHVPQLYKSKWLYAKKNIGHLDQRMNEWTRGSKMMRRVIGWA